MHCKKEKKKERKKNERGGGGGGGFDIDRITYLGAKQMKDEKRVRIKSKRREQTSF